MKFRVDLFLFSGNALDSSIVSSSELRSIRGARLSFYNCGTSDILIDKNIILANNYNLRDDITHSYNSPIFARIYKKTGQNYAYEASENEKDDFYNFSLPVISTLTVKPNKEVTIFCDYKYFKNLSPGEYKITFDYIISTGETKTDYKPYPGMEANCFNDYSHSLYHGFFFQTASNTIHFTVLKD